MLPKRGRPPVLFMMTVEKDLTREDLFRFVTMDEHPRTSPPVIQRLREIHHQAARLVAAGKTPTEVALATGRTAKRIGDLCRDPAFQELVRYFETQIEEIDLSGAALAYRDYADINDLARGEILSRLEDPTKIKDVPVDELRRLMVDTGDRTHTPLKTAVTVTAPPMKITFNMGNRDIRPKDEPPLIEHQTEEIEGQSDE